MRQEFLNPEVFQAHMITHDFPEEETACPIFPKTFPAKEKVEKPEATRLPGVYMRLTVGIVLEKTG